MAMAMEVAIPTTDFDFNSARPTPCSSAPSTPERFGEYYYCSAPTSPTRLPEFYRDFDDFGVATSSSTTTSSSIPFDWEEKPGTPKSKPDNVDDFAFDFHEESENTTLPAEELFESGKIRPLKPPASKLGGPAVTPHTEHTRRSSKKEQERGRGRETAASLSSSKSGHRGTRSQSPHRVSKYPWEDERRHSKPAATLSSSTNPALSASSSKSGSRKWRLKDFFLFRSASEGRAADKDPLRKYTAVFMKHGDQVKSSSFRAIEGSSSSKRKGAVSAHELHYTVNRAVSEDLKKKTFLPYKQGILGRLAFNPAVHALANGFGFSKK